MDTVVSIFLGQQQTWTNLSVQIVGTTPWRRLQSALMRTEPCRCIFPGIPKCWIQREREWVMLWMLWNYLWAKSIRNLAPFMYLEGIAWIVSYKSTLVIIYLWFVFSLILCSTLCLCHKEENTPATHTWWTISISPSRECLKRLVRRLMCLTQITWLAALRSPSMISTAGQPAYNCGTPRLEEENGEQILTQHAKNLLRSDCVLTLPAESGLDAWNIEFLM